MSHTLLRSTRSRVLAACAAAAVAAPLLLSAPAQAGVQMDNPVSGEAGCAEGLPSIIWTITNNVGESVSIDSATLSGAVTGTEDSWTSDPIAPDTSSQAQTLAAAGTTGSVTIVVNTSWVDGEFPMDAVSTANVTLIACEQPTTTTTTAAPTTTTTALVTTTTAPPAAVTAVVVTPRFTG